jgi:hypothetical protein
MSNEEGDDVPPLYVTTTATDIPGGRERRESLESDDLVPRGRPKQKMMKRTAVGTRGPAMQEAPLPEDEAVTHSDIDPSFQTQQTGPRASLVLSTARRMSQAIRTVPQVCSVCVYI